MRTGIRSGLLATLLLCVLAQPGLAQDKPLPPTARDAFAQLSEDLTGCLAYYQLGGKCAANSGNAEAAKQSDDIASHVADLVFQSGQMGGVNTAAMQARLRIVMRDMMAQMDKSCANFAIMIEKYADSCKGIAEHPERRYFDILRGYEKPPH